MRSGSSNSKREWKVIPADERAVYERAGFGHSAGFGTRPALLVIDVQYRTVGDEPLPISESIDRYYKTSCGEMGWHAIPAIKKLLAMARAQDVPVIYPYVAPKLDADTGRTGTKIPALMRVPDQGYAFVEDVAPMEKEVLIPKWHPSAFFGTALTSYLIDMNVDTLLLTGCTTSGCVRATATDAFAYNFHCGVIEEAVYDRAQTVHELNLFDIDAKYADVVSLESALTYLETMENPDATAER